MEKEFIDHTMRYLPEYAMGYDLERIPPSPPKEKARRYSENAVFTGFSYALQLQFRQFKMQV